MLTVTCSLFLAEGLHVAMLRNSNTSGTSYFVGRTFFELMSGVWSQSSSVAKVDRLFDGGRSEYIG